MTSELLFAKVNKICTKYNKKAFNEINMKSKLLRKIMKTKGNKKKSLVEEAIISLLNDHDAYSDEIYNLAEELDISKSTLKRARAELTSEGIIKPKRTGSNKGNDKQRTIFSLVKKVQIQRFKKYSD